MEIRSGLRAGDLGAVVRMHGLVYGPEYALDSTFEASVAERLSELVMRGWPTEREGLWVVDSGDGPVGAITLSDEGDGTARLGHFVLMPEARGRGLGRRMVAEVLAHAREAGYERIELTTFDELTAAGRIYRAAGFRRVLAEERSPWGRTIRMERYELRIPSPA